MPLSGLDVIAYRAYQREEHRRRPGAPDARREGLRRRQGRAPSQGVPKGATFEQFDARVAGRARARAGRVPRAQVGRSAARGDGLRRPGRRAAAGSSRGSLPASMMTAQLSSQATFVRGDDLRARQLKHALPPRRPGAHPRARGGWYAAGRRQSAGKKAEKGPSGYTARRAGPHEDHLPVLPVEVQRRRREGPREDRQDPLPQVRRDHRRQRHGRGRDERNGRRGRRRRSSGAAGRRRRAVARQRGRQRPAHA